MIDSRDVAEMVGKDHNNILKDIRRIIEHLGGEVKSYFTYFIESEYTDVQGKQRLCYLLTKKGCELFATRMTGAKGTQFTVTYIEKFMLETSESDLARLRNRQNIKFRFYMLLRL